MTHEAQLKTKKWIFLFISMWCDFECQNIEIWSNRFFGPPYMDDPVLVSTRPPADLPRGVSEPSPRRRLKRITPAQISPWVHSSDVAWSVTLFFWIGLWTDDKDRAYPIMVRDETRRHLTSSDELLRLAKSANQNRYRLSRPCFGAALVAGWLVWTFSAWR